MIDLDCGPADYVVGVDEQSPENESIDRWIGSYLDAVTKLEAALRERDRWRDEAYREGTLFVPSWV